MPAGGIHLCIAKNISKKLKIKNHSDFFIGNVAPDSWRNSSSTKEGTHFVSDAHSIDYDYVKFYQKYAANMNEEFVLGYLTHLLADKYWYGNDFITSHLQGDDYRELDKACSILIRKYGVPRLTVPCQVNNPIEELDSDGIDKTASYLNSVNYLDASVAAFDIEELVCRIEETSEYVLEKIGELGINR